jgi:hypothetical protein
MSGTFAEYVPPAYSRRQRWRRWLVYIGTIIALPLIGFSGWYYINDLMTDRALQESIAEADRLDPDWRLEDIERKRAKIPDAENSAMCVLKVNELMQASRSALSAKERQRQDNPLADMISLSPEILLSDEQARELRAMLTNDASALEEARKLKDMPHGRYVGEWRYLGFNLASQNARAIADWLQKDACLRAQRGEPDGALQNVFLTLNVARSVGDEPSVISQLIRVACQSVAMQICERALAQGAASETALMKLQKAISEEVKIPVALYAIRGERAHFHWLAEGVRTGETTLSQIAGSAGLGPSAPPGGLQILSERIVMRQTHAPGLRVLTQLVEIAKLPVEQQDYEIKKMQPGADTFPTFVQLGFPGWVRIFEAHARTQAWLRTGIVGIAVERYRLIRGRWPDTLDDLVSAGILPEVPIDPYANKPLRYRRLKDGVVVYCLGPDGKDDGGLINREGDPTKPGFDLGFQLWNVGKRRQTPPPKQTAPEK